jgi:hypothetical protein
MVRSGLVVFLLWTWTAVVCQSAAPAAPEPPKAEDPRLNQTLALDLVRVPLSDLCQVIERRSGVPHRAADAATGDLMAHVVGTLTVAQLQQALAAVLGVGWKQQGEGEAAAYVVERLPVKRMEEAREQAETDRALRESLRRLMTAAHQPEPQMLSRLQRLLAGQPGRREAFQVLGGLTPAEQAQVLAGGSVERTLASLTLEGQALVKKMVEELRRDSNRRADESLAEPGAPRLRRQEPLDLDNGAPWRIQIRPTVGSPFPQGALFSVRVFCPGELGIGRGWGVPMELPGRENPAHYRLTIADPDAREGAPEPPLPDPFEPSGQTWEETARDIVRTLGRPVVSDAYRPAENMFSPVGPAVKEDSLESYLDRFCRDKNRRWGRLGPVLLFQRCDWAILRRAQIPESQARRWKQPIINTGRISFDHLAEMTALTPYQLPNLGQVLVLRADLLAEHGELLRLWKALPEAQRAALRGEGRVIRDLPLAVQPRSRSLVSELLGSSAPLVLANARLRVEPAEEAFTLLVLSPERPAVVRRVELTCPTWFRDSLRKEEAARVAALRAAEAMPAGRASAAQRVPR